MAKNGVDAQPLLTLEGLRHELEVFERQGLRPALDDAVARILGDITRNLTGGSPVAGGFKRASVFVPRSPRRSMRRRSTLDNFEAPEVHVWAKRSPKRTTTVAPVDAKQEGSGDDDNDDDDDLADEDKVDNPFALDCAEDGVSVRTLLLPGASHKQEQDDVFIEPLPSRTNSIRRGTGRLANCNFAEKDAGWSLKNIVNHHYFELWTCFLLIGNAGIIGLDTEQLKPGMEHNWQAEFCERAELVFCVLFSAELSLKLMAYGYGFFTMRTWMWNVFDLTITLMQVVEQLFILMRVANTRNMFLLFRTLRLIRISRLIRMFRLVDELQKIVSSILGSMDSLAWVLLLLVIIIYLFSVVFTQLLCHPELG
eukprot:TRINITY_DN29495_c0_g1_i4.p1 TRINITY_DN29495_c0_g1~~TRINITY_DN29495_c0_g1_i4.p1  ORF type:complete len:367 (-),score=33.21 TRINITY_DN29495_c0_g1_i4:124-1224(-)